MGWNWIKYQILLCLFLANLGKMADIDGWHRFDSFFPF
jgi:hypothetical protein